MRHVVVVAMVSVLVMSVAAVAQETTGGLQGRVADAAGAPLAEAAVEATGPYGAVATVTDGSGRYRLPRLAPGSYVVTASLVGFQPVASEPVRVILGEAVTVDFALQPSFAEEIAVYSDTVTIDFSESQTATSIRQWEIDYLPRGRDFTGINTTDPQEGDSSVPMRAEFMEEIQVKSAGYMAEYGGAMGGVINAVTRSGGNEFHGGVYVDIANNDWNGSARPQYEVPPCTRCESDDPSTAEMIFWDKDDVVRYDPGFFLGGPILRDRLWFFGSYQPGFRTTDRTVEWPSYPSDTYREDFRIDYVAGNLTANVGSRLLLKAGLNLSPFTTEGFLPDRDGRRDIPDPEAWAPLGTKGERETYYLSADWIAADAFVVSARGGFYHTNVIDTGIPYFDVIHNYSASSIPGYLERHPEIPPEAQHDPGWYSDNLVFEVNAKNIYERTIANVDATWYFTAGGDHSLKFGYQAEETTNDVRQSYNADRILYYWDRPYFSSQGEVIVGDYGYFRLLNIGRLGAVEVRNDAVFIQDAWSVLPNLTLNLGLRSEFEQVPNYGVTGPDPAIEFGWGDKLAPRLGFAWDVANNARWKVYGSYGTYYDITKFETPRWIFGGDKWVDFFYSFDTPDPFLNNANTCRTGSNTILESPVCPAGSLIEAIDRRVNTADPAVWEQVGYPLVDPNLKPMETWEAQLGVDHQLTPTIQIGARLVHKELVRAVEDVGVFESAGSLLLTLGNPGHGVATEATSISGATYPIVRPVREYEALELSFDKRFANGWSLRAYYTLSRLWGNFSGLVNSDELAGFADPLDPTASVRRDPNISMSFDWVTMQYDIDGEPVYGRLATDRTHQLRAQLLYSFGFGLSVGVNQYVASGAPRSELSDMSNNYTAFFPYGRGNLGDTPWLTQTDLSLWQSIDLGHLDLVIGLTVLNLFDEDTPVRYLGYRTFEQLPLTTDEFFAGFDYEGLVETLTQWPLYDVPDTFQLPREVRLTLKLEF